MNFLVHNTIWRVTVENQSGGQVLYVVGLQSVCVRALIDTLERWDIHTQGAPKIVVDH
jgi:hypothetical protein